MKMIHTSVTAALLIAGALAIPAAGQETTPAMIAAAEKEGKVVWYASVDVKVAEGVAKIFRATYPKIAIEVERSGSERVFQRINQEYQSNIKNVDVVNSSDASHFIFWKQQKWLAAHTPPDVKRYAASYKDPEGYYATWRASLSVMAILLLERQGGLEQFTDKVVNRPDVQAMIQKVNFKIGRASCRERV